MTKKLNFEQIKADLDFAYEKYNQSNFIADDPISIPHLFDQKQDIEVIGFIMATISWGKRNSIIKNGHRLVEIMGNEPYRYISEASKEDLKDLSFVHRTFNAQDLAFFMLALREIYKNDLDGLQNAFSVGVDTKTKIFNFRTQFLTTPHENRSEKHISNPLTGSASKRINMFLRWMVRKDQRGVDFGLWEKFPSSDLYIPLDVHTGNVARSMGLINRKQNDWLALEELMTILRKFDPIDPSKYDYALFGLGVSGVDLRL